MEYRGKNMLDNIKNKVKNRSMGKKICNTNIKAQCVLQIFYCHFPFT